MLNGLPVPTGDPAFHVRKVALGIHRQLTTQISLGMFMRIARLSHKARLIALRQLAQAAAQAVGGLGWQPPAFWFVTGE